ncbi:hypothetical protein BN129_65 [Cronobacter sakazakii 701]|nr:hypothetical protein BN129_65 [Cronobacter sakazakii 701]
MNIVIPGITTTYNAKVGWRINAAKQDVIADCQRIDIISYSLFYLFADLGGISGEYLKSNCDINRDID